ncbi:hypothetical protein ACMFMG_012163 [Clarireedia jacksonii]
MPSPGPSRLRETTIAEFVEKVAEMEKTMEATIADTDLLRHQASSYRASKMASSSDISLSTNHKINEAMFSDWYHNEKSRREIADTEDERKDKVAGSKISSNHAFRRAHGTRIIRTDRSDTNNEDHRANAERHYTAVFGGRKNYDHALAQEQLARERKAASTSSISGPTSKVGELSSLSYYPSILEGYSGRFRHMEDFPGVRSFPSLSPSVFCQVAVVNTIDPLTCISAPNRIAIKSPDNERLDIALRRTIRVPDNGHSYDLPPNLGSFSLYEVDAYKDTLPVSIVQKGGFFMPIHDREAMFIQFASTAQFAIKIYSGGVNVVSGKSKNPCAQESDMETDFTTKHFTQDHIITPSQAWIDGIASKDGKVQQFVAASVGGSYSVEAQLTNVETYSGLQFEIIPLKSVSERIMPIPTTQVFVKMVDGHTITLAVSKIHTVDDVKHLIQQHCSIPPHQMRLICAGKDLHGPDQLIYTPVRPKSTIHVALRLVGGRTILQEDKCSPLRILSQAPGGFINQVIHRSHKPSTFWDTIPSITFNVQLIDAKVCKTVLGLSPLLPPVIASDYSIPRRLPFYTMFEEPSGVFGSFPVRSLGQIDRPKPFRDSNAEEHMLEERLSFGSRGVIDSAPKLRKM